MDRDGLNATDAAALGLTHCQVCLEGGSNWNYADWILTSRPGIFGLVSGVACPTGVVLILVLTVMVILSMPFVRRSGLFQVLNDKKTNILSFLFQ